jgi:hypothetical protein
MSDVSIAYFQKLARMCGYWATARMMRKRGYSLAQCRTVLFGWSHCRRVT